MFRLTIITSPRPGRTTPRPSHPGCGTISHVLPDSQAAIGSSRSSPCALFPRGQDLEGHLSTLGELMEGMEPSFGGQRANRYHAATGWIRMAGEMRDVGFSPRYAMLCSEADDWLDAENAAREAIQLDLVRLLFCYSAVDCLVRFHSPHLKNGSSAFNAFRQLVAGERTPLLHAECLLGHLAQHLEVMPESDQNPIRSALARLGSDSDVEVCASVGFKIRHAFAHGSFGWDPGRWVASDHEGWTAKTKPVAHLVQAGTRCLLLATQTLLAIAHRTGLARMEIDDLPDRGEIWMGGRWRETLGVEEWIACAHLMAGDGPPPPDGHQSHQGG